MSEPAFTLHIGTLVLHGVGLIGGSLGLAARRYGLADEVVGVGRDASRLETARRLGAIDRYVLATDLASACAAGDLIVLCTPVSKIVRDLPSVLAAARADAVVTDVGSVKSVVVDAAEGDPRFVGSHPMAGSEMAGVEAAKANLFQEATWALTPTETTDPIALAKVRALAQSVGATTRLLSPKLHDEAVAITSHLPHVIAYALMSLSAQRAAANPDLPFMTAGSFAGATRVAASMPTLWSDIASANRNALGEALRTYRARLDQFQEAIDNGDFDKVEALFQAGYEAKRGWRGR